MSWLCLLTCPRFLNAFYLATVRLGVWNDQFSGSGLGLTVKAWWNISRVEVLASFHNCSGNGAADVSYSAVASWRGAAQTIFRAAPRYQCRSQPRHCPSLVDIILGTESVNIIPTFFPCPIHVSTISPNRLQSRSQRVENVCKTCIPSSQSL